jgi:hypothetical protein
LGAEPWLVANLSDFDGFDRSQHLAGELGVGLRKIRLIVKISKQ